MDNKPPPYTYTQTGYSSGQQNQPGIPAIPVGQPGYPPNQQAYYTMAQPTAAAPVIIVAGGNCPNCRIGLLVDDYGCLAIFMAIFFFPIGILCCLAMRERVCMNCGCRY